MHAAAAAFRAEAANCTWTYQPATDFTALHAFAYPASCGSGCRTNFWNPSSPYEIGHTGVLTVAMCETKRDESGAWYRTQKIGPFHSLSGTWWRVGYRDVLGLEAVLEQTWRRGNSLGISAHSSSAVDASGNFLPHPPIHIHHSHITENDGAGSPNLRHQSILYRLLTRNGLDGMAATIYHHADDECTAGEGGVGCFVTELRPNYKLVNRPLWLHAEINDWRPASDVSNLTWWYELAVRLIEVEPAERGALSMMLAYNPPGMPRDHAAYTFPVTLMSETFMYYVNRLPTDGTLVSVYFHSHEPFLRCATRRGDAGGAARAHPCGGAWGWQRFDRRSFGVDVD